MKINFSTYLCLVIVAFAMSLGGVACFNSEPSHGMVFVSEIDGDSEIFQLDTVTGDTKRITSNSSSDIHPVWSPDHTKIAYIGDQSGSFQLYVADPEQGVIKRLLLSDRDMQPMTPLWSPDGEKIAFAGSLGDEHELYVINSNGSNGSDTTRITFNNSREDLHGWSPDGEWLVFSILDSESEQGLWLRNPNGVNLVQLTKGRDTDAEWSPDGNSIVFSRQEDDGSDIYVLKKSGDNWAGDPDDPQEGQNLTDWDGINVSPTWSPDSKKIAFVSDFNDDSREIYIMEPNPNDVKKRRLTRNDVDDAAPVWSPDGKQIAFVSYLYELGEIIVLDVADKKQNRLTTNEAADYSQNW